MAVYSNGANWSDRDPTELEGASDDARYYAVIDKHGNVVHEAVKHVLLNTIEQGKEGVPVNAGNLNAILAAANVTTGTESAFVLAQKGFMLFDGACVRFRVHVKPVPGPDVTLDVNNTGPRKVVTPSGKPLSRVEAGVWLTVIYSAVLDFFILQGEGGGMDARYGNGVGQISTYELMMVGNFNPYYGR